MCSIGHYRCAQWEMIMSSTGHYWGAQQEVMCSTGSYVLNWTFLECSIMCSTMCPTGHFWHAQCKGILGAPLEIYGVHIVVIVTNIPNVKPAVIYMPFKSTLTHEFDVWFLHGRLD